MGSVATYSVVNALAGVAVGTAINAAVPAPEHDKDMMHTSGIATLQILAVGVATAIFAKLASEGDPTHGLPWFLGISYALPSLGARVRSIADELVSAASAPAAPAPESEQ